MVSTMTRTLVSLALLSLLAACQPTPERVCRYVGNFETPPAALEDNCVESIQQIADESGEHWEQIGACLMDAEDASQTETCIAVADTIALQGLCNHLLEFADSEFESAADSSLTSCLRRLRSARRDIDADWSTYEACLRESETLAAVTECNLEHQRQLVEARRERLEAERAERAEEAEEEAEEDGETQEEPDEAVID